MRQPEPPLNQLLKAVVGVIIIGLLIAVITGGLSTLKAWGPVIAIAIGVMVLLSFIIILSTFTVQILRYIYNTFNKPKSRDFTYTSRTINHHNHFNTRKTSTTEDIDEDEDFEQYG